MISPKDMKNIIRINVDANFTEGVIVSADIRSRSRPNLMHYTRIVFDPFRKTVIKATCDCEGYTFRRKCWHIKALEELIETDMKLKEEVEKLADELRKAILWE